MKQKITAHSGLYIYTFLAIVFIAGVVRVTQLYIAQPNENISGMLIGLVPITIMFGVFANHLLGKKSQ